MEKLSGILAASPRVRAVDLDDSHPVRPGAPTFGQKVGSNLVKDRFTISQKAKDVAFGETLAKMDPKEQKSVKIADQMYKNFFDQKLAIDEAKTKPGSATTFERQTEIPDIEVPEIENPVVSTRGGTTSSADLVGEESSVQLLK